MYRRVEPTDIVGHSYGHLKVVEHDGFYDLTGSGRKKHWYLCKCDCGNRYLARRDHLLEVRVKSCGSCQKIVDEGEWFRYITSKGESFIFDQEDYDLACSYSWCITAQSAEGKKQQYAITRGKDGHNILFSRMIMSVGDDQIVDHINGDTLDNRRKNLRLADITENSRNTRLRSDNKTGFKGVGRLPDGRYRAYIGVNDRFIALGVYKFADEAARAYDKAARFYFGNFACVNFPLPGGTGVSQRLLEWESLCSRMKRENYLKADLPWQSEFSHSFACWANNHRGWAKMKKDNKRLAKRREKRRWKEEVSDALYGR